MLRVTKNKNIVNLQGISMHQNTIYLLLEYCAQGSVEDFLRKKASYFQQCAEHNDYKFLLKCCSQVTEAMVFLVDKGIIHGDLAARNILIDSENTIKVADFGLSQRLYVKRMGRSQLKDAIIPVKYSSPEVLRDECTILEYSDVWSFGVYMWEIFQLGCGQPYPSVRNGKLNKKNIVQNLHRLFVFEKS